MSGPVIASPSNHTHSKQRTMEGQTSRLCRGHRLLARSLFRCHQSLTLPGFEFTLLNRHIVLPSAFSRGLLTLARQNLLAVSDSSSREEGPSLLLQMPTSDTPVRFAAGRQTSGARSPSIETQVKHDENVSPPYTHQTPILTMEPALLAHVSAVISMQRFSV